MANSLNGNRLLSVDAALDRILTSLSTTTTTRVLLAEALGQILAEDIHATLTLPPEDVSAMDGYAVRADDVAHCPAYLTRVGESAAGHPWTGHVELGQAVRIFTGGYVPNGADTIIIQENVDAPSETNHTVITVREGAKKGRYVRPAGLDISAGALALAKGTLLSARSIGLAIAAGATSAVVSKPPRIGILSTGDELVLPGQTPGPGQIISSNAAFLSAFVTSSGAEAVDLGIAIDKPGAVSDAVIAATNLDMVITTGGASVGNHDYIVDELAEGEIDFWKIAMRPGKPLIWGKIGKIPLLGLPGNPVSTAVCALVFLAPAISKLGGGTYKQQIFNATITSDLPKNDQRQDYLRANMGVGDGGMTIVRPAQRQDSSMMATLANADAFIVRPPFDPPISAGDTVSILPMPRFF
jgi:molybdopterin molybdotransferase